MARRAREDKEGEPREPGWGIPKGGGPSGEEAALGPRMARDGVLRRASNGGGHCEAVRLHGVERIVLAEAARDTAPGTGTNLKRDYDQRFGN